MTVHFFSDLHITSPQDRAYQPFLGVLRDKVFPGDTLVLAGDIFDLFIGSKEFFSDQYSEFFKILRALSERQVSIFYIEGNHDFHMRKALSEISSLQRFDADFEFEVAGKRFYVAHGDLSDQSDWKYLTWRKIVRSPIAKIVLNLTPSRWLSTLGIRMSEKSRAQKPLMLMELPEGRQNVVRTAFRKVAEKQAALGFDYVVMGHCHDLDEKYFGKTQYINVGYPKYDGKYLVWSPSESALQANSNPPIQRVSFLTTIASR